MPESKYVTVLGDTWDVIAKKVYGNEYLAGYLMEKNPDLLDIFVFDVGTVVDTPEYIEVRTSNLPPWRT